MATTGRSRSRRARAVLVSPCPLRPATPQNVSPDGCRRREPPAAGSPLSVTVGGAGGPRRDSPIPPGGSYDRQRSPSLRPAGTVLQLHAEALTGAQPYAGPDRRQRRARCCGLGVRSWMGPVIGVSPLRTRKLVRPPLALPSSRESGALVVPVLPQTT